MPNQVKYGRSCGNQVIDPTAKKFNKVTKPKRILPKYFRDDPFAEPPPISEEDI